MFDSGKAIIFPSKGIALFMEGLNPGHCVYDMHPPLCHRSQLQGDRESKSISRVYPGQSTFISCVISSEK